MLRSSDDGSDTSVEGLIERFRHGYPLHALSPRRRLDGSNPSPLANPFPLDGDVDDDIEKLHDMVQGRGKGTPTSQFSQKDAGIARPSRPPRISTSPTAHRAHHRQQVVSPDPPPPPPRRSPYPVSIAPRDRLDEQIALMMLDQQHQQQPMRSNSIPAREIHVTSSTADVIRKTAVDIDKDMTHVLSGFVERNARELAEEAKAQEDAARAAPPLPASALTVATELDAAFDLLTKRVKGYAATSSAQNASASTTATQVGKGDAQHAVHVVHTHGATTEKELWSILERLEKASEAAAATSPQLDHILHSQVVSDDRDLREILHRVELVAAPAPATSTVLFAPTALGVRDASDDVGSILDHLQRVKARAMEQSHAIQARLLQRETDDPRQVEGPSTHHPRSEPPRRAAAPLVPSREVDDNQDLEDDNDDEYAFEVGATVSAHDIVEDLSVAMHTLRHRLNLDAREKQEKDAMDAAQKVQKAKAAADAELAKQRAEQAQRDEANARARVMGRTACTMWHASDDEQDDQKQAMDDSSLSWRVAPPPSVQDEATDVMLRFDMLVRGTYDSDDDDGVVPQRSMPPRTSVRYPSKQDVTSYHGDNNQEEHWNDSDFYRGGRDKAYRARPSSDYHEMYSSPRRPTEPRFNRYMDHSAMTPTVYRGPPSPQPRKTVPMQPHYPLSSRPRQSLPPPRDYSTYGVDDLRRAREAKMAWLKSQ